MRTGTKIICKRKTGTKKYANENRQRNMQMREGKGRWIKRFPLHNQAFSLVMNRVMKTDELMFYSFYKSLVSKLLKFSYGLYGYMIQVLLRIT